MYYFRFTCKNQHEIIFLRRVCLRFRRKFKINRGLVETLRNFGDTLNVLFLMYMQKISRKLFFYSVLPPLPFLAKTKLHAYRRKVKINRGLVETLRNIGDTLNVLFEMSMQ